jgi:hypothetical protein
MPIWFYTIHPFYCALCLIVAIELIALTGLFLTRRLVLPHLHYYGGSNDAVSGTVQAIGVFYGITVGLIAVGVWNTHSDASELVSKEASSIGALYRDVGGYPEPLRGELRLKLRDYTVFVIDEAWPAQQSGLGQDVTKGKGLMDDFQQLLYTFQPANPGQAALQTETLTAFNKLIDSRNLRIDAVNSGLSPAMWAVIWVGAAISICIAYFYKMADLKLHAILIFLMAAFLAMLIFMITINDRPFFGQVGIPNDPYKLILQRVIDGSR